MCLINPLNENEVLLGMTGSHSTNRKLYIEVIFELDGIIPCQRPILDWNDQLRILVHFPHNGVHGLLSCLR